MIEDNVSALTIGTEEDTVGVLSGKAFWLHRGRGEDK